MREPIRIVREEKTPGGEWVRAVLVHGGYAKPSICVVASDSAVGGEEGQGPIWVDLEQAEALAHMLANAITIARLSSEAHT